MDLTAVHDWARTRSNGLRLDTDWKLFQNSVAFSHYDGSKCRFTNSWVEMQPCDWAEDEFFICIFTEHHGHHIYCSNEFRYIHDDHRTFVLEGKMVEEGND